MCLRVCAQVLGVKEKEGKTRWCLNKRVYPNAHISQWNLNPRWAECRIFSDSLRSYELSARLRTSQGTYLSLPHFSTYIPHNRQSESASNCCPERATCQDNKYIVNARISSEYKCNTVLTRTNVPLFFYMIYTFFL